jgi:hypothetical protein
MFILKNEKAVEKEFEKLKNPVRVFFYSTKEDEKYPSCMACPQTSDYLKFLESASKGIVKVTEFSLVQNPDAGKEYNITLTPSIYLPDFNILFTGAPFGSESVVFIRTLVMASTGETDLGVDYGARAKRLKNKLIRTIISPTCPYCPTASLNANKLSIASGGAIRSEIIESFEFPDLAQKYGVSGVPAIVVGEIKNNKIINDELRFQGITHPVKFIQFFESQSGGMNDLMFG